VKRDGIFKVDNATGLITAGIFLLMLVCLPLVLRIDEVVDRNRPMYTTLSRMTLAQDKSLLDTGKVVPVQLSGGESATIGTVDFVSGPGVSVVVRGLDGDTAYCVTVSNEHGAESDEHCS
jgi:hypothetical protein